MKFLIFAVPELWNLLTLSSWFTQAFNTQLQRGSNQTRERKKPWNPYCQTGQVTEGEGTTQLHSFISCTDDWVPRQHLRGLWGPYSGFGLGETEPHFCEYLSLFLVNDYYLKLIFSKWLSFFLVLAKPQLQQVIIGHLSFVSMKSQLCHQYYFFSQYEWLKCVKQESLTADTKYWITYLLFQCWDKEWAWIKLGRRFPQAGNIHCLHLSNPRPYSFSHGSYRTQKEKSEKNSVIVPPHS